MAPSKNGAISSENRFVVWGAEGAINIKPLDEDVLLFLFKNGSVFPAPSSKERVDLNKIFCS
jgi:hypothetical protein